jgi:polysaccharide biosynthesis transport protein
MTLSQYLRVARTNWLLIAALTALGALGAAAYAWAQTPTYSASAQLFVSTTGSDSDIATITQGSTLAQQRVKSYAAIITAPDVLDPVIKQLGLPYANATELTSHVSASSPLDTVLLDVKVTDTVPERARDTANAIAAQFTDYVGRLELPSGKGTSPVKVTVTAPAVAAGAPDSPKKMLDLALGLLVGLGLGIGLAVLRDSLDRTIGAHHDPGEISGAPVLAGMSEDPSVKDAPLIVHDPFAARAEAFRQLRTNIRYLSVDQEVRALVITSSIAGEGKTTTAANLAIAMAQGGENVVLVDADLRRPSIAELFGLPSGVGLTTVLVGDVPVEDAVQTWRDDLNLSVLTSGPLPPNPSELIGSHRMAELITQLTSVGFMVVVDSPPLLPVTDAAVLARLTGGALVVTRIGSTRIEQLGAAVEALRTAGATVLGVVANRLPRRRGAGGYAYRYGYGSDETYAPASHSVTSPAASSARPAPPGKKKRTSRMAAAAGHSTGSTTRTAPGPGRPKPPPSVLAQAAPVAPAARVTQTLSAATPVRMESLPPMPAPPMPAPSMPAPPSTSAPTHPSPAPAPAPAPARLIPQQPAATPDHRSARSVAEVLSPTGAQAPRAVNVLAAKGPRLFSRAKKQDAAAVTVTPPPIGPPPTATSTASHSPQAAEHHVVAAPPMVSATPVFTAPVPEPEPSFDDLVETALPETALPETAPAEAYSFSSPPLQADSDTADSDTADSDAADSDTADADDTDADDADSRFTVYSLDDAPAATAAAWPAEAAEPQSPPANAWAQHGHWIQADVEPEPEPATPAMAIPLVPAAAQPITASAVTRPQVGEDDVDELDHEPVAPLLRREPPTPEPPAAHPMFTPRPALPEAPRPTAARRSAPELPPIWSPKPAESPTRPGNLPLTSASASPSPSAVSSTIFEPTSAIFMPADGRSSGAKRGAPLASVSTVLAPPATVLDVEAAHELDTAYEANARVDEITLPEPRSDRLDSWYAETWSAENLSAENVSAEGPSAEAAAADSSWSVDYRRPDALTFAAAPADPTADDLPALADLDTRPDGRAAGRDGAGHLVEPAARPGFLAPRSHRSEARTAEERTLEMRAAAMREAAARVAAQREAQLEAQREAQEDARTQAHDGWPVEQRSNGSAAGAYSGGGEGWPFSHPTSPADRAPEPWPGPDITPPAVTGLDDLLDVATPHHQTRRDGGGWRPSRRR